MKHMIAFLAAPALTACAAAPRNDAAVRNPVVLEAVSERLGVASSLPLLAMTRCVTSSRRSSQ